MGSRLRRRLVSSTPPISLVVFVFVTLTLVILVFFDVASSPLRVRRDEPQARSGRPIPTAQARVLPFGRPVKQASRLPNFDFDAASEAAAPALSVDELDHVEDDPMYPSLDETEEEWADEDHGHGHGLDAAPLTRPEPSPALPATSFLPFLCPLCDPARRGVAVERATCAKYGGRGGELFQRSVAFAGTGREVRRALGRAARESLLLRQKIADGVDRRSGRKMPGVEPFKVLILGGSVSNCRGVDQKTECWHSHVERWFRKTFPLDGDELFELQGMDRDEFLRERSGVSSPLSGGGEAGRTNRAQENRLAKRGKSSRPAISHSRHYLVDGAKSATSSSFYAYCLESELDLRSKSSPSSASWEKGPDLVLLEFGINDLAGPSGPQATRDFERLIRVLRGMKSRPALLILEAASWLLARTTGWDQAPEFLHLPAAQWYDIPLLSAKSLMFSGLSFNTDSFALPSLPELFLPDKHHPSAVGHQILADLVISYLEEQACQVQSEALLRAAESRGFGAGIEPSLDFPQEERVLSLPPKSLFDAFEGDAHTHRFFEGSDAPSPPQTTCYQVGTRRARVKPIKNKGWTQYAWSRDKQYMIASEPGSTVTYELAVGSQGGDILIDWLRSAQYELGDALAYLDGNRQEAVQLASYWPLGWSIGVPTVVFQNVSAGKHQVSLENLGPDRSSHPKNSTNFRLLALIVAT